MAPHPVNLPNISLRMLEIFATMMRCSTTVETADVLRISQPAVSAGLRQLEGQLGITLFERTARRMVPTAEARELYEEIRPMFGIIRGFSVRARDLRLGMAGRLRVMSTPPLGNSVAPLALERLLRGGPDVSVSFDVRRLEGVLEAVQTGIADIGLALTQDRFDTVSMELLQRTHMVALVPAASPLAAQPHITPADLESLPMVGLEQDSNLGQLVRTAFDQAGVTYAPRVEVRYCETAAVLAKSGLGVAIVDPYSARIHRQDLVERPFLPLCEVHAVLFTRRGVPQSSLMHRFIAQLRTSLAEFSMKGDTVPMPIQGDIP